MTFLPAHKQEKKMTLNLKQIVTPKPTPKPVVPKPKPKPIIKEPVLPKPIVEKIIPPTPKPETIKKKVLDDSKKVVAQKSLEDNNVTKVEPKPEKKQVVKKDVKEKSEKKIAKKKTPQRKITKKRVVKKKSPKRSNDSLANALSSAATASGAYGEQMIKKLYGSEFDSYNQTQKKFIKNNLGTIHRITQHTLNMGGYPEIAVRTRQQGTNIVSFYLHPNGDISGLRLKRSLGYDALDSNTLEVIRTAYKDYPLPNKKTRIIFHVQYSLY